MEFCWVLPVKEADRSTTSIDKSVAVAGKAESYGFESVLVSAIPETYDPWILAREALGKTERIRTIVAQNSNHVLPTYCMKALNTLNGLFGDRADLNIVTGSSPATLARDANADNHEVRYEKTREFMEVVGLTRGGAFSYNGKHFNLANANIFPPEGARAKLFLAGSSAEAKQIAAAHADFYLMYASDMKSVAADFEYVKGLAERNGRNMKCGIYVHIVARETNGEAWEAAHRMVAQASPVQKKLTKMFLHNSDSVGLMKHRDMLSQGEFNLGKHLWGGLTQISNTVSVSIVGNYGEVADTLREFGANGADCFLLTGRGGDDHEIDRIGEHVLTRLRGTG